MPRWRRHPVAFLDEFLSLRGSPEAHPALHALLDAFGAAGATLGPRPAAEASAEALAAFLGSPPDAPLVDVLRRGLDALRARGVLVVRDGEARLLLHFDPGLGSAASRVSSQQRRNRHGGADSLEIDPATVAGSQNRHRGINVRHRGGISLKNDPATVAQKPATVVTGGRGGATKPPQRGLVSSPNPSPSAAGVQSQQETSDPEPLSDAALRSAQRLAQTPRGALETALADPQTPAADAEAIRFILATRERTGSSL